MEYQAVFISLILYVWKGKQPKVSFLFCSDTVSHELSQSMDETVPVS